MKYEGENANNKVEVEVHKQQAANEAKHLEIEERKLALEEQRMAMCYGQGGGMPMGQAPNLYNNDSW